MKEVLEKEIPVGEFYQSLNGNVYFKISSEHSAYIGNKDMTRADKTEYVSSNSNVRVNKLSKKHIIKFLKGSE